MCEGEILQKLFKIIKIYYVLRIIKWKIDRI